jgi:hypothetical protein
MHHSGFKPLSSHGNFSSNLFCPKPMEPIKPYEDFFFLSYQNFKEKYVAKLSLQNMPQPKTEDNPIQTNIQ